MAIVSCGPVKKWCSIALPTSIPVTVLVADRVLRVVERRKIQSALEANLGNKSKTADDLGVSYKTLLNKIKEYAL